MAIFKQSPIDHEVAEIILLSLRRAGFTCGIVGGYARDTFLGFKPKDMDICVAVGDMADREGVEYTLDEVWRAIMKGFPDYINNSVMGMYNDHASDRACGVIKFEDHGIDVILYKDCTTMPDILNSFDFNLNQFGMDGEHDDIPVYGGSTSLCVLEPVRDDCSEERAIKMIRKHHEYHQAIDKARAEGRIP